MEYHVYWSLKSSCFEFFGVEKYGIFSGKKLMEIWYLLITEKFLFLPFRWWEIRSFLESKSWWKNYIYWLLRRSFFELFGDGKYVLFFSQKVDGKMIFIGYWEVIFIGYWEVFVLNFLVMGNTVFFQPKSWWKDDIYLVFFSFPWYSSTWGIWFFVQCLKKS